jgi:glycerophosphoryl diester phosphodiesterase
MSGNRRKREQTKKILIILLMLVLCILSVYYIFSLAHSRNEARQAETAAAEEAEQAAAEAAEEEAAQEAETAKSTAGSRVYAHRGSAGDDELSFAAYDKAVEAGAGYIEADMVVSADGTVYVAHEDESKPMTGYDGYFSGMSDSQIDSLTTRSGNKVLKLTDLFDKYGDSVTYIVDIKYNAPRNAEAFVKTVKEYGNEKNVVAASFLPKALSAVEEELPDMTKIYLCSDQGTFNAGLGYSFADILCVPADIMNADNLKAAHDNSKQFSAWTLNTEEEIKNAIELGVDAYFTDDSALAVRLEEENRPAE